ncbi:MAG: TrmO family methyltransferase [Deltaproteobacteria bacterium]|jgi:L-fuculose-phosphate aldolase|nr:TrmO family methyltransferase [Deltaproteobacteria bacterium]
MCLEDGFLETRLKLIGLVRSPLRCLEDCPHWHTEGPPAVLEILPDYRQALEGMRQGQEITLLTWLHLADRATLLRHNKLSTDRTVPPRGVFNTHSPFRPNPIGVHNTRVSGLDLQAERPLVRVNALEALDGTPILDIKTDRRSLAEFFQDEGAAGLCPQDDAEAARLGEAWPVLAGLCRRAGEKGLLPGFSGNASMRLGEYCLLTRRGAVKSALGAEDFAAIRLADSRLLPWGGTPSSEYALHLEIYRCQPRAEVILHTHPPALLALGARCPDKSPAQRLNLPIFEAQSLRARLTSVPALTPGSAELGLAAGEAARGKNILWLEEHGLCVWAGTAEEALALSEETEHLARVALMIQSNFF